MSKTTRRLFIASAMALGCGLATVFSSAANAASIQYGTFGPIGGIVFTAPPVGGVTESSGTDTVPLYGPPTPFSVGLDFDPQSFVASSAGGGADITDGQLNFTLMSTDPNVGISSLTVGENGDYTLVGVGTSATQVFAGAIIIAKITEVNGAPTPGGPLVVNMNASLNRDLVNNSGVVQPWSLSVSSNFNADLIANGIAVGARGATKIEVAINNSLVAISEPTSVGFIAKKDFVVSVGRNIVPEPSAVALAGVALCGLGLVGRKRS